MFTEDTEIDDASLANRPLIDKHRAMRMRMAFGIVAVALVATAAGAGPEPDETLERTVDEAVAAPLRDRRFSGVVLVAKDGRTLLRKAYGLADHERAIPNTPRTRFMIMSVSKQFTAALILRLAAQNRLGLHDRVSDYLPASSVIRIAASRLQARAHRCRHREVVWSARPRSKSPHPPVILNEGVRVGGSEGPQVTTTRSCP